MSAFNVMIYKIYLTYLNIKIQKVKCSTKQGAEMSDAWYLPP